MKLILRWFQPESSLAVDERTLRFKELLRAVERTRFYRSRKAAATTAAGLGQLARLPRVAMEDFLRNPQDFYKWGSSGHSVRLLDSPVRGLGRTAVLSNGFTETASLRVFPHNRFDELARFMPETLAGPVEKLCILAELIMRGRVALPTLQRAVIAFTGLKHGTLSDDDRDLIWQAFQVPVFEQFRGFSNELLAWECEAHRGLHIVEENAVFEMADDGEILVSCLACSEYTLLRLGSEMAGTLDASPCPCGRTVPRLRHLKWKATCPVGLALGMAAAGAG